MADTGRRDPRYPCALPVVLKIGRTQLALQTEDVSYSGAFLVTSLALPLRQLVQIEAEVSGEVLVAHAMVVFARSAGDTRAAGVGLKFFGLSRDTLERWARFVRGVQARTLAAPTAPRSPPSGAPRAAVVLRLRPEGLDALLEVYTRDIADGGMFVETEQPLLLGSRIKTELVHPDTGETFELECIVRRIVTDPKPGIGVEFVGLDPERREALHEFVSSVVPAIVIEELAFD